jgi:hypothetical protein
MNNSYKKNNYKDHNSLQQLTTSNISKKQKETGQWHFKIATTTANLGSTNDNNSDCKQQLQ